jgi:predicted peroxiredoxin
MVKNELTSTSFVLKSGVKFYICNIVAQKMYNIKFKTIYKVLKCLTNILVFNPKTSKTRDFGIPVNNAYWFPNI